MSGKKKIVAIIQARMGSQRLPGKVMLSIGSMPILGWVITRVKQARLINKIVVVTSAKAINSRIVKLCKSYGIPCMRGPENDVLQRYYAAARKEDADIIIRITGDCPFIDPVVIDQVISSHLKNNNEYTTNDIDNTFPRGMDVEVINFTLLKYLWKNCSLRRYREHVTPFIYEYPDKFKIQIVRRGENFLKNYKVRLCVDEKSDLILLRKIYNFFAPRDNFSMEEILGYLSKNKHLLKINKEVIQKKHDSILIRVDGNHSLGYGHVVREMNLATQFKKKSDMNIAFMFRRQDVISSLLKKEGFQAIPLGYKESFKQELTKYQDASLVIVDTPLLSCGQLDAVKKHVKKLVHVTDDKRIFCGSDLTIVPNLLCAKTTATQGKIFKGKQYLMLNEKFMDYRKEYKVRRGVRNILVCFGGSDPNDITKKTVGFLRAYSKNFSPFKVTVILGPGNKKAKKLTAGFSNNIKFHFKQAADNMAKEFFNADLAIVSGGTLMYEACAIGVPSLIICQNRAQAKEAEIFHKQGAVINLGCSESILKGSFLKKLESIILNTLLRKKISSIARKYVDPQGNIRIAKLISKLVSV